MNMEPFQVHLLPQQNGLNGQMRITDGHGNVYLSVEDYKRPKFETEFTPQKAVIN